MAAASSPTGPPAPLAERFPQRAEYWQIAGQRLPLTRRPLLMGIVNVTPDSFSDGGRFFDPARAVEHALQLVAAGADILDIGGESTRPYATPVSAAEEIRRVVPVITALQSQTAVPLSIDTSKPEVAQRALAAGAAIINDVAGLRDPEMLRVAAASTAGICAMHMQGDPQTMQDAPRYDDVVQDILAYLRQRRDELTAAGIDPQRIALDPGVGFGKTHQHNLDLLAACWRFHELGAPLLLGPSRKGFIAKVLGDKQLDRTPGTIGTSLSLAMQGVQVLRVHDVAAVRQSLELFLATGGLDGAALQLAD